MNEDWHVEDVVVGAFLGAWVAASELWSGTGPPGLFLVVVVFAIAIYLRLLRSATITSKGRQSTIWWAVLIGLLVMDMEATALVRLAEGLQRAIGFGMLITGWTLFVGLRPSIMRLEERVKPKGDGGP